MTYLLIILACLYTIVAVDQLFNWESPSPAWAKWTCCALWPFAIIGFTLSDIVWGNES